MIVVSHCASRCLRLLGLTVPPGVCDCCVSLCLQVFEEALKVWRDKQKIETPVDAISDMLSEDETQILHSFVDATQMLIKRSVQRSSIRPIFSREEVYFLFSLTLLSISVHL